MRGWPKPKFASCPPTLLHGNSAASGEMTRSGHRRHRVIPNRPRKYLAAANINHLPPNHSDIFIFSKATPEMKMELKKASLTGYSLVEEAALPRPRGLLSHRSLRHWGRSSAFAACQLYVECLYRNFDLLFIHISPGQGSKQKEKFYLYKSFYIPEVKNSSILNKVGEFIFVS